MDINAYLKKSIPFSGKLTSTLREQFYVQEIVDVLFFACTILERSFGKEIHQKVLGTLQILKQHYSGNYPTPEIIKKAQSHIALQNPVFSGFSKALEYAEIIIKDQNLIASEQQSHLTTQSYLFDIAQLFEVYLEKLLGRHLPDWSVSDQAALTLYPHQFYKRRMFPDLVLRHKQLGKVMVFDAKFKNMRLEGRDVDRADFYQIHTYIQYYQPDVLFGGLLYPLSKNDVENSTYAGGLFRKAACETGFMVDGVYVDEKMDEHTIISNELQLIERIKQKIHTHLYH